MDWNVCVKPENVIRPPPNVNEHKITDANNLRPEKHLIPPFQSLYKLVEEWV